MYNISVELYAGTTILLGFDTSFTANVTTIRPYDPAGEFKSSEYT